MKDIEIIFENQDHNLKLLTPKELDIYDEELCVTTKEIVSAVRAKVCKKCETSDFIVLKTSQPKPGIENIIFQCQDCLLQFNFFTSTKIIKTKTNPKSWLPNYMTLSFLVNGQYYKDYQHIMETLCIEFVSEK